MVLAQSLSEDFSLGISKDSESLLGPEGRAFPVAGRVAGRGSPQLLVPWALQRLIACPHNMAADDPRDELSKRASEQCLLS